MEKYRTAGRLIILSLVTSLQERQRHWQFALQFLFAALHGQQPRPLFRAQAPLHGQETSTDPWSYLTRMANFTKKKLIYEWKWGGSTFSLSSECSQRFSCSSLAKTDPKALTASESTKNQWIHLIPYRIKTYITVLNRIILISSPNSSEKLRHFYFSFSYILQDIPLTHR